MKTSYMGRPSTFGALPIGTAFGVLGSTYTRYLKIKFAHGQVAAVSLGPHPQISDGSPIGPTVADFDEDDRIVAEEELEISPRSGKGTFNPERHHPELGDICLVTDDGGKLALAARTRTGSRGYIDLATGLVMPQRMLAGCFAGYVLVLRDALGERTIVFDSVKTREHA